MRRPLRTQSRTLLGIQLDDVLRTGSSEGGKVSYPRIVRPGHHPSIEEDRKAGAVLRSYDEGGAPFQRSASQRDFQSTRTRLVDTFEAPQPEKLRFAWSFVPFGAVVLDSQSLTGLPVNRRPQQPIGIRLAHGFSVDENTGLAEPEAGIGFNGEDDVECS